MSPTTTAAIAAVFGFACGLACGAWWAVRIVRRNTRALRDASEMIRGQRAQIAELQSYIFPQPQEPET